MANSLNNHTTDLYKASTKKPEYVRVPAKKFLMIDGSGDPATVPEFQEGIEALYTLAYTMKFDRKKRGDDSSYKIPPVEALWWSDDPKNFMEGGDKTKWQWRLMLSEPDSISQSELKTASKEALQKKELPAVKAVRLEKFTEGPSMQVMHVGPYSSEGQAIERLHQSAKDAGYEITGKFHEIYIGDPRRSAPEKLKTILRQPVRKAQKSQAA